MSGHDRTKSGQTLNSVGQVGPYFVKLDSTWSSRIRLGPNGLGINYSLENESY